MTNEADSHLCNKDNNEILDVTRKENCQNKQIILNGHQMKKDTSHPNGVAIASTSRGKADNANELIPDSLIEKVQRFLML